MEDPSLWASLARKMTLTSGTSFVSLSAVDVLKVIMVKLCAEVQPLWLPCTTIPLSFHLIPAFFFQFLFTNHISQLNFFREWYEIVAIKIKPQKANKCFCHSYFGGDKIKGIEYSIYLLNPSLFTAALLKSPFFSKWFYVTGTPKSCQ